MPKNNQVKQPGGRRGYRMVTLKPGKRAHLSVQTESDLVIAVDAEAVRRSKKMGHKIRRSDVVTVALREWLKLRTAAK